MGASGPVIGGWLIDLGSWRAIFTLNLPLACAAIILAWRFVPQDPNGDAMPLDTRGGILATAGLAALTWALTVGSSTRGWTLSALIAVGIAGAPPAFFLCILAPRGAPGNIAHTLVASQKVLWPGVFS